MLCNQIETNFPNGMADAGEISTFPPHFMKLFSFLVGKELQLLLTIFFRSRFTDFLYKSFQKNILQYISIM